MPERGAGLPLRELQEMLYDLITAPAGVMQGLEARGLPPDALDSVIVGDGRLSAAARLDIYANMYFFRILDVLREEYPRVAAALGGDAFHDLITDYLLAERPAHPSLREVGARLPGFLRTHRRGTERPWLPELAELERAHRELFDAADAAPLSMAALQALPPESFSTLPVRLIPAHRLLVHAFAAAATRQSGGEPEARPETLLVWRRETTVHHRPVENEAEAAMLRRADAPTTFTELCDIFVAARGAADEATLAAEAFQVLARWVDDAILIAA
jgi:hypothetical protein